MCTPWAVFVYKCMTDIFVFLSSQWYPPGSHSQQNGTIGKAALPCLPGPKAQASSWWAKFTIPSESDRLSPWLFPYVLCWDKASIDCVFVWADVLNTFLNIRMQGNTLKPDACQPDMNTPTQHPIDRVMSLFRSLWVLVLYIVIL